jgi:hypothetical protein
MPNYLAVIYDPSKERPSTNLLIGHMSALEKSAYTYARSICLPPIEDPNTAHVDPRYPANAVLKPVVFKSIDLKPQANLDVDKELWQIAAKLLVVQELVNKEAITVILPDEKLLKLF